MQESQRYLVHMSSYSPFLGLDEKHEFTEFTEAVNFGACREF